MAGGTGGLASGGATGTIVGGAGAAGGLASSATGGRSGTGGAAAAGTGGSPDSGGNSIATDTGSVAQLRRSGCDCDLGQTPIDRSGLPFALLGAALLRRRLRPLRGLRSAIGIPLRARPRG
jgi:hypothetical protein